MPVVFRARGYRFFFYSNEGSPREPPDIHVEAGEALRELLRLVEVNRERIETAWRNFFR